MKRPLQSVDGSGLRLPQDVLAAGDAPRGVPDLTVFTEPVAVYAARHRAALDDDNHYERVLACWGLVSKGSEVLDWADAQLRSENEDLAADAAGILVWVGIPEAWKLRLRTFAEQAEPVTEAIDILLEALPEDEGEPEAIASDGRLYNGEWDAFTESIMFTTASLDAIVAAQHEHMLGYPDHSPRRYSELRGDLATLLSHLEPWATPMWKELWVETANGGTAQFLQHDDRANPTFPKKLGVDMVATAYSAPLRRNGEVLRYGISSFTYMQAGQPKRFIEANQQSRWHWYLDGEPLPFEDLSLYEHKQIPKRLSLETINRYCLALGIDRANPDFYGPRGVLIERDTSSWRPITNTMSAAEWRQQYL